jgi:TolB-like protein/Tfp pilus assembly protein PilF
MATLRGEQGSSHPPAADRLDSWKEIAAYLRRGERTARRWERTEGLPIHRHHHESRSTVYAIPAELDAWLASRRAGGAPADDATTTSGVAAGEDVPVPLDSLAVLPFANSGDPDTEYLSDGITETLINSFARVPHLRVVPRSVVFRHKGSDLSPKALGAALDARLLLSGRVMQRGDRLSVQAELVHAGAEQQLWGERFNRHTADIFDVEDEIARQIAERLQMQLSRDDTLRIPRRSTEDSEAYQLYLKARFHWRKRSARDLQLALDYFRQATIQDPSSAAAHAGLAETHCVLVWYGVAAQSTGLAAAEAAGAEAVRTDSALADAHSALGLALAMQSRFGPGQRHLRRAIELDPAYYLARDWYALMLSALGRHDEAMDQMRRARQIDPLSPVIHHHSAWVYFLARRFDDAIRISRRALDVEHDYPFGYLWQGIACTEVGDHEHALTALQRAVELLGSAPVAVAALGHAYGRAGRPADARAMLERLESNREVHVDPYHVALVRLGFGDDDGALAALTRAAAGRRLWHAFAARCDARLDPLRSHPAFPHPLS